MNTMLKNDIIRTILSLPLMDRIEIIDKVYEGFNSDKSDDFENIWAEESERRLDEFLNGSIEILTSDDVFNKINDMK